MTSRIAFAVFLLCPLASGCGGLFEIGARNLFNEAKVVRDEKFERVRYACLAHEAWESIKAECPTRKYSVAYAEGFKEGFVDYLFAGGCGEPPSLPPKRFRHFHAESPQGAEALQDWYGGFRHGAAAAKQSGQRQFTVVSLPMPAPPPLPPPPAPLPGVEAPAVPSPPLSMPRRAPSEAPRQTNGSPSSVDPKATPEMPPSEEEESTGERPQQGPALEDSTAGKPAPEEQ